MVGILSPWIKVFKKSKLFQVDTIKNYAEKSHRIIRRGRTLHKLGLNGVVANQPVFGWLGGQWYPSPPEFKSYTYWCSCFSIFISGLPPMCVQWEEMFSSTMKASVATSPISR